MPQFVDIAPALGINLVREMYGLNVIDFNNDGRLDLFFSNHNKHPLSLFKQQASGQMVDVATQVGLKPTADHHGASWGDCDNDGRPDLYISVGADGGAGSNPKLLYQQSADNTFTEVATSAGVADPLGRGRASSWADYDNDGDLDLLLNNLTRTDDQISLDKLFRNEGNCTFTSVKAGALTSGNHSNGAAWADYDNDGDMDVLINGSATTDLYRNDDGNFVNVSVAAGIRQESGGAGVAWGDYDNDGKLDLFIARGWSPRAKNMPSANRLYRNKGNGTFARVETAAGVSRNLNSHDATWADFDNDGDLDLYVTNSGLLATGEKPNFLYMNQGNKTFVEVAKSVGAEGLAQGLSGGVAVGDVNADGFLDIVLVHGLNSYGQGFGPNQLLQSQGNGNHWLQIKLVGRQSNWLGIGARVEIITSDNFRQVRQMNGGTHHYSQDEMLLSFGFGQRTQISKLTIYWPRGLVQQLTDVAVDQRLTITEPSQTAPEPAATEAPMPTTSVNTSKPEVNNTFLPLIRK